MNIRLRALLIFILLVAAFLRLYRIADLTQFRGDQGSAGIVIYEALQKRELPLVGPTVSTGQRPGPAYYYLIALPLILSGFNPLVPAMMFALLGVATVYLLYYLGSRLFGKKPGLVVATLYAFSPAVVAMDRTMWNPTAIPFLVMVVIVSLYKVYEEKKLTFLLVASFCLGILVQLHYTNALWIVPLSLLWLWKVRSIRWGILTIVAFLLPLTLFMYYQIQHQFIDIRQLISIFLNPPARGEPGLRFIGRLQYVVERAFFAPFPKLTPPQAIISGLLLLLAPFLLRKQFWSMMLAAFTVGSIGLFSWYKGPFFDHYLWFLLPIPFLLVGACIFLIPKRWQTVASFLSLFIIIVSYIPKLELTKPKIGDITRTRSGANTILADSKGEPFSFGLISSFSYSDLHYRFFFLRSHREPTPVLDSSYQTLYLVCEGEQCPPFPFLSISDMKEIRVYCYEHVCKEEYPMLDLTKFTLQVSQRVAGATIYTYHRK